MYRYTAIQHTNNIYIYIYTCMDIHIARQGKFWLTETITKLHPTARPIKVASLPYIQPLYRFVGINLKYDTLLH